MASFEFGGGAALAGTGGQPRLPYEPSTFSTDVLGVLEANYPRGVLRVARENIPADATFAQLATFITDPYAFAWEIMVTIYTGNVSEGTVNPFTEGYYAVSNEIVWNLLRYSIGQNFSTSVLQKDATVTDRRIAQEAWLAIKLKFLSEMERVVRNSVSMQAPPLRIPKLPGQIGSDSHAAISQMKLDSKLFLIVNRKRRWLEELVEAYMFCMTGVLHEAPKSINLLLPQECMHRLEAGPSIGDRINHERTPFDSNVTDPPFRYELPVHYPGTLRSVTVSVKRTSPVVVNNKDTNVHVYFHGPTYNRNELREMRPVSTSVVMPMQSATGWPGDRNIRAFKDPLHGIQTIEMSKHVAVNLGMTSSDPACITSMIDNPTNNDDFNNVKYGATSNIGGRIKCFMTSSPLDQVYSLQSAGSNALMNNWMDRYNLNYYLGNNEWEWNRAVPNIASIPQLAALLCDESASVLMIQNIDAQIRNMLSDKGIASNDIETVAAHISNDFGYFENHFPEYTTGVNMANMTALLNGAARVILDTLVSAIYGTVTTADLKNALEILFLANPVHGHTRYSNFYFAMPNEIDCIRRAHASGLTFPVDMGIAFQHYNELFDGTIMLNTKEEPNANGTYDTVPALPIVIASPPGERNVSITSHTYPSRTTEVQLSNVVRVKVDSDTVRVVRGVFGANISAYMHVIRPQDLQDISLIVKEDRPHYSQGWPFVMGAGPRRAKKMPAGTAVTLFLQSVLPVRRSEHLFPDTGYFELDTIHHKYLKDATKLEDILAELTTCLIPADVRANQLWSEKYPPMSCTRFTVDRKSMNKIPEDEIGEYNDNKRESQIEAAI